MAILYGQKKSRNTGYVGTFLKQVKQVLQPCIEKNIKIVSNAGGLNPAAMADAVKEIAKELNLDVKVAYIDGDDLAPRIEELQNAGESFTNMDTGVNLADTKNTLLTANTYLGAWGIKEALDQGADLVICLRVTDAAVVIGPAAWKFNWQRTDYDALAGALAAGHVIECGQQATGGNYAFFQEVPSFDNPGLDIEAKAEILTNAFFNNIGGKDQFDDVSIELIRSDKENPQTNEEAFARLRIVARSCNKDLVGRLFNAKLVELFLANIPGIGVITPIGNGDSFLAYWPTLVDNQYVTETVHLDDNVTKVKPTNQLGLPSVTHVTEPAVVPSCPTGDTVTIPLGRLFGTRSGDKGGCANVGVWATNAEAYGFLHQFLTVEKLKELMPEAAELEIIRYDLANIHSLNFFIKGVLGEGVASSVRIGPQAKSLGEYLRAKVIDVPASLTTHLNLN